MKPSDIECDIKNITNKIDIILVSIFLSGNKKIMK